MTGLPGLAVPEEYGGGAGDTLAIVLLSEELASSWSTPRRIPRTCARSSSCGWPTHGTGPAGYRDGTITSGRHIRPA